MKHLPVFRQLTFQGNARYLFLSMAMLLVGTVSIMVPASAQTVATLDPGNVAVFTPDGTDFDTSCDPIATCDTSDDLGNNKVGNYVVTSGTSMSDLARSTMTKQFTVPTQPMFLKWAMPPLRILAANRTGA